MRYLGGITAALLAASLGYGVLFKRGLLPTDPAFFAGLVSVTLLAVLLLAVRTGIALVRERPGRLRRAFALVFLAGLLLVGIPGLANWLWSLQVAVILIEGEEARLDRNQVQVYEAGPFADTETLRGSLSLLKMKLVPAEDGFVPRSKVLVRGKSGEEVVELFPNTHAVVDDLAYYQGAFGYAPRIVVLKDDKARFDKVIPFLSRRPGGPFIVFSQDLRIEAEDLDLSGEVVLRTLDEDLRGHPALALIIKSGGEEVGRGELMPGHFTELPDGRKVGYAGLERWSEIDVATRSPGNLILAGFAVSALGAVLWLLTALVGRLRR